MKRSWALTPLSHDHHQALDVARRLRTADSTTLRDALTRLGAFGKTCGERHFASEEAWLTPELCASEPTWARAVARMIDEHREIERRAGTVQDVAAAQELGELLHDHVRFEERELFPIAEATLDQTALDRLGEALRDLPASAAVVFAVAGGNHVTIRLDRATTDGAVDIVEVLAQPGGGPPPHRHAFGEWFRVLSGELTLTRERDGVVRRAQVLQSGDSVWIEPGAVHGTLNLSDAPVRFEVIGQPGAMTGYFAQAGVRVADELTPPATAPAGPDQLAAIAERWGIEFWTGPVDRL